MIHCGNWWGRGLVWTSFILRTRRFTCARSNMEEMQVQLPTFLSHPHFFTEDSIKEGMLRGKWYLEGAKSIASRLQILMWPCCDSSAYFLAFRILHETPNWCGYSSWRQLACVWVCDAICRERMQLTTCRCLQAVVDTSLVNLQVQTPCQVILSSDWSFSLVLVNWHCFLVQFCRWRAHAFSLIAERDGPSCPRHLRWSMKKPCKFVGLRLR